ITLRNWRIGDTYGPRDKEDIVILGKVLNIRSFVENAQYYYNAMSYIRTERRVSAKVLNTIIYMSKKGLKQKDLDFLEKYNLSIEELQDAIKFKKIKHIS